MWPVLWLAALVTVVFGQFDPTRPCFCKIGEAVDSCSCNEPNIDHLNNVQIYEKLQKLLKRDFFRFYRVNMDKPCPFWPDDRQCGSKQCGIAFCDDEVPAGLRRRAVVSTVRLFADDYLFSNHTAEAHRRSRNHTTRRIVSTPTLQDCPNAGEKSNDFDPMDRSLDERYREQLREMDIHDDQENKFCEVDDEDSTDMHYVDLSKNPERYTGYSGDSALRVWKSIYQENCFKPDMKFDKNFLTHPNNFGLCLEKRVFYRLISGFHSAITISIAAYNYKPPPAGFGVGSWFRNTEMFAGRFGTKWSWEGPQRLKNVYFVFLLELRALLKVGPYLQKELFYTGNEKEDIETRVAIDELLDIIRQFPDKFDEHELFTGVESHARELREEFRSHFLNISRIMDCVACDKCRLWGKVQIHGMGTALKILFSDLPHSHYRIGADGVTQGAPFQLTRNEVVSLFQSLGRYSSSIKEVGEFRKEMLPGHPGIDEL
ncbi:endoplasmic Reticulum Oxidoreductin 1 [Necator americanus]|uniref:Endoplasmic Reticulum Oxidoreductin 1 n=1 Tax=Necator americanus TaxID=51031 RepID=W2THQ4_NECAM|nr:endoplasmic Reticulum Oxidoreductin 1 [Necator americanus]ETN81333.1 endoplasmic Reticulum Oxidoreductin 1 [Necator americanus]